MYAPEQKEIDDKVQDLLADKLQEDSLLCDALVSCLDEFREFYRDSDAAFEFKEAIDNYIVKTADLEELARTELIAEIGYTVRTDVDDFEFIPHDTRY